MMLLRRLWIGELVKKAWKADISGLVKNRLWC